MRCCLCFVSFSEHEFDTELISQAIPSSITPLTSDAWFYKSASDTGSRDFWGKVATYGGGGYTKELTKELANATAIINELKNNLWLEQGTRVLFIDFTTYNANINLFCIVRLVFEFPATGGVFPSHQFNTVKLLRYVSSFGKFSLTVTRLSKKVKPKPSNTYANFNPFH